MEKKTEYSKLKQKLKTKEYSRIYYQKNKTKLKNYSRKYAAENTEKVNEYQRQYYKKIKTEKPELYKERMKIVQERKKERFWKERMEKPINERIQHLTFSCSGNKFFEKLREKNLEYLYRKAPELKDKKMSDDELVDYILKNENI